MTAPRERERERTQGHAILQNRRQKEGDVTVLWESQFHSSINIVQNNSKLSDAHTIMEDQADGINQLTCQSQLVEETSINDCSLRRGVNGIMGVPISFLEKFSPDQFEIIWLDGPDQSRWYGKGPALNGKHIYRRIFIKHKEQP